MACYERFHWSHEQVRTLPLQEAELLSIYFEEVLHYEKQQLKRAQAGNDYSTEILGSPDEINLFEDEAEMERLNACERQKQSDSMDKQPHLTV